MTDTTTRNFLGIPIVGTITEGEGSVEQYPREQFEPIVKALLDDPYIVEFGWQQYTPYFNDGDPCIFSAYTLWVRTQDDQLTGASDGEDDEDDYYDEDDHEDLSMYSEHPSLGGLKWSNGYNSERVYVGTREESFRRANALNSAIEVGHFNNVLLELFGDHAQITVRRTGISVDEYSHD